MNYKDVWDLRGSNSAFTLQQCFPEILEILGNVLLLLPLVLCSRCQQGLGRCKYELLTSGSSIVHGAEPTALLGLVWENANPPVQRMLCASAVWVVSKAGKIKRFRRLRS